MDGALGASLSILKVLYETAELYNKMAHINERTLNEIALLACMKDQIESSKRMAGNQIVEKYMNDIHNRLMKLKTLVENVEHQNFIRRIMHTKKIEKTAKQVAECVKKLKLLLEMKRDLSASSKLDIANIISDVNGRAFWDANFGSDNLIIRQNLFFSALRLSTNLLSSEIDFLKKVVNDDNDEFISAFEFQEWLDLFGDYTVVMRRTIDSLFDGNTEEVYTWYYKNCSKTMMYKLLADSSTHLIIRRHTTQRGVLIANFYISQQSSLCTLYIRNKNNVFTVERIIDMSNDEVYAYESLRVFVSHNLHEIVKSLLYFITGGQVIEEMSWQNMRHQFADKTIADNTNIHTHANTTTNSIGGLLENINPFPAILDKLPELPTFTSISSKFDSLFCFSTKR
jgi:hypothetical protein